jgi:hypothetical protein
MRKFPAWLAVLLLVAGLGLVAPSAANAANAAPYCGITWGSQAKSSSPMVQSPITNVRSGKHPCFERLVVDLKGKAPGYTVRYVKAVYAQGSGKKIPLRGGAFLDITVKAPAYNSAGHATYSPKHPRNWSTWPATGPSGRRRGAAASRESPPSAWASGPSCPSGYSP